MRRAIGGLRAPWVAVLLAPASASTQERTTPCFYPVVGEVGSYRTSLDGSRVVYLANQDQDEVFELYAAPIDGSTKAVRLDRVPEPNRQVLAFEISRDSASVALTDGTLARIDSIPFVLEANTS